MRILAGTFKGRKLLPPPSTAQTRPITGMVKKSLMGMLTGRLDGAAVVDLYCGTGTLGLEAISAGAERCCFAERDRNVLLRLTRNIEALGVADRCTLWRGDVQAELAGWLAKLDAPIDVAFVDPPYSLVRTWDWAQAGRMVFAPLAEHLADEGLVVLRLATRADCPATVGGLTIRRQKAYGDMKIELMSKAEAD